MKPIDNTAALLLIDLQRGFDDPSWGPSSNPRCEENCRSIAEAWAASGRPIIRVRHDSPKPDSPLAPRSPGNALLPLPVTPDLLLTKTVNSAFFGEPDLHTWLTERDIGQLVMCGIQTNMCVETTARMAGNLGYDVLVPLDATRTFDLLCPDPVAGNAEIVATADDLMRITAVNLQGGGFATVTVTRSVLAAC